jgi:hypothetical protein
MPADLATLMSSHYVSVYERLTASRFVPAAEPADRRVQSAVQAWLLAEQPS